MTILYIDADACPVKGETLKVAERHAVEVVIVSNGGIRPSRDPMVKTVVVPEGPDAADMWIADRIGPGDDLAWYLTITADSAGSQAADAPPLKPGELPPEIRKQFDDARLRIERPRPPLGPPPGFPQGAPIGPPQGPFGPPSPP